MSNRSWFFAVGDQQQGPYSEEQLRDFIGRGSVRSDTYVWTEGMTAWQRAGDIPGLQIGARRLASGILTDLFQENLPVLEARLRAHDERELAPTRYLVP